MQTANLSDYIDYFRQLAILQTDLQHNPAGETGDADTGSVHFARWTADEIITGLRTKVSFPALMLELYEVNTKSSHEWDIKNYYTGAFSIVCSALPGIFASEVQAFALSENIMRDILQHIWNDHYGDGVGRCAAPFEYFDFNNLNITFFGPILNNEFGYRCEFSFMFKRDLSFAQPPPAGSFIDSVI